MVLTGRQCLTRTLQNRKRDMDICLNGSVTYTASLVSSYYLFIYRYCRRLSFQLSAEIFRSTLQRTFYNPRTEGDWSLIVHIFKQFFVFCFRPQSRMSTIKKKKGGRVFFFLFYVCLVKNVKQYWTYLVSKLFIKFSAKPVRSRCFVFWQRVNSSCDFLQSSRAFYQVFVFLDQL